jgi:hypothetical protein
MAQKTLQRDQGAAVSDYNTAYEQEREDHRNDREGERVRGVEGAYEPTGDDKEPAEEETPAQDEHS